MRLGANSARSSPCRRWAVLVVAALALPGPLALADPDDAPAPLAGGANPMNGTAVPGDLGEQHSPRGGIPQVLSNADPECPERVGPPSFPENDELPEHGGPDLPPEPTPPRKPAAQQPQSAPQAPEAQPRPRQETVAQTTPNGPASQQGNTGQLAVGEPFGPIDVAGGGGHGRRVARVAAPALRKTSRPVDGANPQGLRSRTDPMIISGGGAARNSRRKDLGGRASMGGPAMVERKTTPGRAWFGVKARAGIVLCLLAAIVAVLLGTPPAPSPTAPKAWADPCPPDCGGPTGPTGPSMPNGPTGPQGPPNQPSAPASLPPVPGSQGSVAKPNPMNGTPGPGNLGAQQQPQGPAKAGTNGDAYGPDTNQAPHFPANQGPFQNPQQAPINRLDGTPLNQQPLPAGHQIKIPTTDPDQDITLVLPHSDQLTGPTDVGDGVQQYTSKSFDILVDESQEGLTKLAVTMKNPSAPTSCNFPMRLPDGASIQPLPQPPGAFQVIGPDGQFMSGIQSPGLFQQNGTATQASAQATQDTYTLASKPTTYPSTMQTEAGQNANLEQAPQKQEPKDPGECSAELEEVQAAIAENQALKAELAAAGGVGSPAVAAEFNRRAAANEDRLQKSAAALKNCRSGGGGSDGIRNPAQDKLLTKGDIQKLKDAGYDIHDLKGYGNAANRDLYKDRGGNIYVKPKGGSGEGESLNININDL